MKWVLIYFFSIAVAWWLGYRLRPRKETSKKTQLPRDYLMGLNFLLNEETDKAVDIFIKLLEVDSSTVETHLAVGKLFRCRGEVERAIRIHQNLIARPQLEKIIREQALFELGQDYLSAGVLDRAERIFHELVNSKSHSAQALKALIDIYQQEKSWENAIKMATRYASITKKNMQPIIAHYYCELAELTSGGKKINLLDKASKADANCVRASLLLAKMHIGEGNYEIALGHLKKIKDQNTDFLAESIDLTALCYEKLNCQEALVDYLKQLLNDSPHLPAVLMVAEQIQKWKGDQVAVKLVADYVRRYPSLRGLYLFINFYVLSAEGRAKEDLLILQKLIKKLLTNKSDYQCISCGFSGKSLHWQCPGCKQWTTIKPISNLEERLA